MFSFFQRRSVPPADDWFKRAKPEQLREYAAFGPWIYEVQSREEMPPRFLPWYSELEAAFYVLKIPINKDRRDARPGQDLYRAIIAVEAERVVFLNLNEAGAVDFRSVPLSEIQGLRNYQVLLHAEFVFYLQDGNQFSFSYNAVSRPLVEKVLDFLSDKISGTTTPSGQAAGHEAVPVLDHFFKSLVREHQFRHPGCSVVFCEEPGIRYRDAQRRRQRSLGLLVFRTRSEWLFLDRGSAIGQASASSYAGSVTWIPFSRARGFDLGAIDPLLPGSGREFLVRLSGHDLKFRLLGSDEAVGKVLKLADVTIPG